jgi:hypothetical protein
VTLFLQAVADGLQMGLLDALVAVGLTIIWGLMEMINFAHGELMMLGMFGAWGLSVSLGWDPLVSMVPLAVIMYGVGVLVYRPLLLLLDEAMSGLTPTETAAAVELVRRIHRDLGLAICVVEHVMEVVMPLSHRVIVLDHGEKLAEGPPAEIARDERVITAYLGDRHRARA